MVKECNVLEMYHSTHSDIFDEVHVKYLPKTVNFRSSRDNKDCKYHFVKKNDKRTN